MSVQQNAVSGKKMCCLRLLKQEFLWVAASKTMSLYPGYLLLHQISIAPVSCINIRSPFVMYIKSQRQTLTVTGLHLSQPCFSHDQLYVGCSKGRCKIPSMLALRAKTKYAIDHEVT